MKNKKAQHIFSVLLVFVVFIALFSLVVIVSSKMEFNQRIGENQFKIIKTAQKANEILFYLDKSVDISADIAENMSAAQGGFLEASECGKFHGFNLWNCENEKFSFPKIKSTFIDIFAKELDKKLENHNYLFSTVSYHLFFLDEKLKGNALLPLQIKAKDFIDSSGIGDENIQVAYDWENGGKVLADFVSDFSVKYNLPYVWGGVSPYSYSTTIKKKKQGDPVFRNAYIPEKIPSGNEMSGQKLKAGFDCSGFVWWSLRHLSLDVKRKTAAGFYSWAKENGNAVCDKFGDSKCTWDKIKEKARPGDLLFIDPCDSRKICHIGIYVGGGQLVESAGGVGLVKRDIPENYMPGNAKEIAAVYRPNYALLDKFKKEKEKEKENGVNSGNTPDFNFVYDKPSTGDELIYSVYPSFVSEGIDIGMYEELKKASLFLIDKVNGCNSDLDTCIDNYLPEINSRRNWKWSTECGSNIEKFKNSISDEFNKCFNTPDNNCYCRINSPKGFSNFNEDFLLKKEISEDILISRDINDVEELNGINKALRSDKITRNKFSFLEVKEIFNGLKCLQRIPNIKSPEFNLYLFEGKLDEKPVYIIFSEKSASLSVFVEKKSDKKYYKFYELPSSKLKVMFLDEGLSSSSLNGDLITKKCLADNKCLSKTLKDYMQDALKGCPEKPKNGNLKIAQMGKELKLLKPVTDFSFSVEYSDSDVKINIKNDDHKFEYSDDIFVIKNSGEYALTTSEQLGELNYDECAGGKIKKATLCVETSRKMPRMNSKGVGFEKLIYNFALYFSGD
ncbi:MAG: C40 family peptidase [Nanobdellota archaeon]